MKDTRFQKSLVELWTQAQTEKLGFIKRVSDLEARFLRKHNLSKRDVSFVWLDELLLGFEVREGRGRRIIYEEELTSQEDLRC